ncbi:Nn.00g085240.m01.CDS01 [Neocucurbitaria sp. VM-36]
MVIVAQIGVAWFVRAHPTVTVVPNTAGVVKLQLIAELVATQPLELAPMSSRLRHVLQLYVPAPVHPPPFAPAHAPRLPLPPLLQSRSRKMLAAVTLSAQRAGSPVQDRSMEIAAVNTLTGMCTFWI